MKQLRVVLAAMAVIASMGLQAGPYRYQDELTRAGFYTNGKPLSFVEVGIPAKVKVGSSQWFTNRLAYFPIKFPREVGMALRDPIRIMGTNSYNITRMLQRVEGLGNVGDQPDWALVNGKVYAKHQGGGLVIRTIQASFALVRDYPNADRLEIGDQLACLVRTSGVERATVGPNRQAPVPAYSYGRLPTPDEWDSLKAFMAKK